MGEEYKIVIDGVEYIRWVDHVELMKEANADGYDCGYGEGFDEGYTDGSDQ